MRQILLIFVILISACYTALHANGIPARPNPPKLVNILTQTQFITPQEIATLEQKLVDFSKRSSNQIVVVVVDHLNGMTGNEYATEIGHEWGVGQQDKDNGIVVLISLGANGEQRYYYIAVGYGLEAVIPDLAVKRIQEKELVPYLKAGNYFTALDKTTTVLIELAEGEYPSEEYLDQGDDRLATTIFIIILVSVVILSLFFRNHDNFGGGSNHNARGFGYYGGSGFGSSSGRGGGFGGFGGGGFGGGGAGGSW